MKKILSLLVPALMALPFFLSCSNDGEDLFDNRPTSPTAPAGSANTDYFPTDDGSTALPYDPAEALNLLLTEFDPYKALDQGDLIISDKEFAEIKKFVDENLKQDNERDTYKAVFEWLVKNLKYAHGSTVPYIDPYDVFVHRSCVCQGYANLLQTMLLTQGMPTLGVNGWLSTFGAHAWNYAYVGGEWLVCDATNNMGFKMSELSKYRDMLIPTRVALDLFEDEQFAYGFDESQLSVSEVKPGNEAHLIVPFSVGGYIITRFAPMKPVPANFKQLYVGKNIVTFSGDINIFTEYTPSIEEVFIDTANPQLNAHKGVVYRQYNDAPYYIPTGMKRVELKPLERIEKNTIYDLPYVEEVVFAEGTKHIEAYAIENCPMLKRVYIPETVKVIEEDAIYRCPANVEIVRTTTGIHNVQM